MDYNLMEFAEQREATNVAGRGTCSWMMRSTMRYGMHYRVIGVSVRER